MFQTFLVDSANKIKVIGNSIHNLSVKELVGIEVISQLVTMIQADSAEYHYGVVGENMTASRKVILKNTGKEMFRASPLRWIFGEPLESERQKEWGYETYMCKMFVFISHSILNHLK